MKLELKGSFHALLHMILSLFICLYWVLLDSWKGAFPAHPGLENCPEDCCVMPPLPCHTLPDMPCCCAMNLGMFILLIWSAAGSVFHPTALVLKPLCTKLMLVASCTFIYC